MYRCTYVYMFMEQVSFRSSGGAAAGAGSSGGGPAEAAAGLEALGEPAEAPEPLGQVQRPRGGRKAARRW